MRRDSAHNSSYRLMTTRQLQLVSIYRLAACPRRLRSGRSTESFSNLSDKMPTSIVVDWANKSSSSIEVVQSQRRRLSTCDGKIEGTKNPFSPSLTISRYPFQSDTTAGRP